MPSLEELLSFLLGKAEQVITFFSDYYYDALNVIDNVFTWLDQKRDEAVELANQLLQAAITGLSNFLQGRIQWLDSVLTSARQWLYDEIIGLGAWAQGQLQNLSANAWDWADNALTNARSYTLERIGDLGGWIQNNITNRLPHLESGVNTFFSMQNPLENVIGFLTTENINTLIVYIQEGKEILVAFISNPLGFIIVRIFAKMPLLLSWVIAIALGTTKYELPEPPNWNDPD